MKRWALLTVVLYILCMSILVVPLFLLVSDKDDGNSLAFLGGFYVYLVPVMILAQVVLLLVPLAVVRERPIKRRKVLLSAIMGAIPMGAMATLFFGSIILMIWGENGSGRFMYDWPGCILPFCQKDPG